MVVRQAAFQSPKRIVWDSERGKSVNARVAIVRSRVIEFFFIVAIFFIYK